MAVENPVTLLSKIRRRLWRLSMKGLSRGTFITRYAMYEHLARVGTSLPNRSGNVLAISHSSELCGVLGIQPNEIVEANYPEHDMTSLQFPDESFDFVMSDQVLAFIEGNPQQAIDESRRVLRQGGIAIHTTICVHPIWLTPHYNDYWRFTPEALRLLCRQFSEVIDCGGWGNFEAWFLIRDGMRYEGIPHATWHPLHRLATRNDPIWPIVTWIVARK